MPMEPFLAFWRVFPATAHAWNSRPLTRPLGVAAKNKAPERGSTSVSGVFHLHRILFYIAHFWPKSKPYRVAKAQFGGNLPANLAYRLTPAPDRPFPATGKVAKYGDARLNRRFRAWRRKTS